jgi:hypothetical protein
MSEFKSHIHKEISSDLPMCPITYNIRILLSLITILVQKRFSFSIVYDYYLSSCIRKKATKIYDFFNIAYSFISVDKCLAYGRGLEILPKIKEAANWI